MNLRNLSATLIILVSVLCGNVVAGDDDSHNWEQLLQRYVSASGRVDYHSWAADAEARRSLDEVIEAFARSLPSSPEGGRDQVATAINLHNALAYHLVLQHYPISSIRNIRNVFERPAHPSCPELSLESLRRNWILPFTGPRAIPLLTVPAASAPPPFLRAVDAANLDQQMNAALSAWLTDISSHRFVSVQQSAQVSMIWLWEQAALKREGGIGPFLAAALNHPDKQWLASESARISYLPFDWSLNDQDINNRYSFPRFISDGLLNLLPW